MYLIVATVTALVGFLTTFPVTPPSHDSGVSDPAGPALLFEDCNGNGVEDTLDIGHGTSEDCDGNGIPDECDAELRFSIPDYIPLSALAVTAADLDLDGDLDAVSAGAGGIQWTENQGSQFGATMLVSDEAEACRRVAVSDLDGDGQPDVLWSGKVAPPPTCDLRWTRNEGSLQFAQESVVFSGSDQYGWLNDLALGDVDGDGDDDVVAGHQSGLVLYRNDRGTFAAVFLSAGYTRTVSLGDLDGDSDLDLVFATGGQALWRENLYGNGAFAGARPISVSPQETPDSARVADLDGDGDLDVLTGTFEAGQFHWYSNDGQGTFGPAALIGTGPGGDARGEDLDGDGDPDLLTASLGFRENLGGGAFGPYTFVEIASAYAVADLDLDLYPDILGIDGRFLIWFRNDGRDCNNNEIPDDCEPTCMPPGGPPVCEVDCNDNGEPDSCDVETGTSLDCDGDGIPDECETDCDGNGIPDACDVQAGTSPDCDGNLVPDECDPDCNDSGVPDSCDVLAGTSSDCNGNLKPDECEPDCNENGISDQCDLQSGVAVDCNGNLELDSCDLASGTSPDCNDDGIPDECQPADCNENQVPDVCEVASGAADDCDADGVPDECGLDCNASGVPDVCDISSGASVDCNSNGVPDECDVVAGGDCNGNSVPDDCDVATGTSDDCTGDVIPDECQEDCDGNLVADVCDLLTRPDCNGNSVPDDCDLATGISDDCTGDGIPDECQEDCDGNLVADLCEVGPATFDETLISDETPAARHVDVADVDADGDLDVLSASFIGSKIAWYENLDGAGSFGPQLIISSQAAGAQSVLAVDLDGDGDLDALSASANDDKIAWYENVDGDGTFGPERIVTLATNYARRAYAADLDGDDDLDVLSASENDGEIAWYENLDGTGTFGVQQIITSSALGARAVYAADLDGDMDVDVLSASWDDDTVAWYENLDGAGTFGSVQVLSDTADGAIDVLAADLDGDGDLDVLSAAELGPEVAWFENLDGAGQFGPKSIVSMTDQGTRSVCAVDIDEDGDLDVVAVAAVEGAVLWYANDGGGSFSGGATVAERFAPETVVGADVDGDGRPDLVVSLAGDGEIAWYGNSNPDCNANGVPDECEPDCDSDGTPNGCDSDTDVDGDDFCDAEDCDPANGIVWTAPGPAADLVVARSETTAQIGWSSPLVPGGDFVRYDVLRSSSASELGAAVCLATDVAETQAGDGTTPPEGGAFFYLVRAENDCPGEVGSLGTDSAGIPRNGPVCR